MNGRAIAVGVDAGGSKTIAWAVESHSVREEAPIEPLGHAVAGPGNLKAVGFESATQSIHSAVSDALAQFVVSQRNPTSSDEIRLCLSAAGAGREGDRQRLESWARGAFETDRILITDDALPVLAAASARQIGITLICGTGSFAWGRNEQGRTARCGGWGSLFGDEGSGYSIGLAGLRAAARAADGRGAPTVLLDRLLDHFEINAAQQLVDQIYRPSIGKREIARLSEIVLSLAESDPVARCILDEAASELALLVETLLKKLDFADARPVLALSGGLLVHQAAVRDAVLARCGLQGFQVRVISEPVAGAVRLAAAL